MMLSFFLLPDSFFEGYRELIFDVDHNAGKAESFTISGRDVDYLKAVGLKATKAVER